MHSAPYLESVSLLLETTCPLNPSIVNGVGDPLHDERFEILANLPCRHTIALLSLEGSSGNWGSWRLQLFVLRLALFKTLASQVIDKYVQLNSREPCSPCGTAQSPQRQEVYREELLWPDGTPLEVLACRVESGTVDPSKVATFELAVRKIAASEELASRSDVAVDTCHNTWSEAVAHVL